MYTRGHTHREQHPPRDLDSEESTRASLSFMHTRDHTLTGSWGSPVHPWNSSTEEWRDQKKVLWRPGPSVGQELGHHFPFSLVILGSFPCFQAGLSLAGENMTLEQLPFPTGSWHHLGFPSILDTLPRVEGSEKQLEFNSLQAQWICSNQKLSECWVD